MPTYVYACGTCGAEFEQFQRFSDEPLTICPRCQGTIKRVFQPVGIVFKGSGWYVNDSRKTTSSSTPAASPSSDASKPSEPAAASESAASEQPAPAKDKAEPAPAAKPEAAAA